MADSSARVRHGSARSGTRAEVVDTVETVKALHLLNRRALESLEKLARA